MFLCSSKNYLCPSVWFWLKIAILVLVNEDRLAMGDLSGKCLQCAPGSSIKALPESNLAMTRCPNCNSKIPFRKFLWLHNYSRIRCKNCHARLVPDRKVLSVIGGVGGLEAAVTVWLMAVLFRSTHEGYTVEFIGSTLLLVGLLYLAMVLITQNVVDFWVDEDTTKKHKR